MFNSQFLLSLSAGLLLSLASVSLMLWVTFKRFPDLFYTDRIRPHHYRIVKDQWGRYEVQWAYWWQPFKWRTAYKFGNMVSWGVYSTIHLRTYQAAMDHLMSVRHSHAFQPSWGPVVMHKS